MLLAKIGFLLNLLNLFLITQLKSFVGIRFSNLGFAHLSSRVICSKRLRFGRWFYIGRNTKIELMFAKGYTIGKRFTLKDNSVISSRGNWNLRSGYLSIGNNVGFSENAKIYIRGDISIGSDSIFGPNVTIVSDEHFISSQDDLFRLNSRPLKTIIGENVWVGANVVILGNTEIGSNSIVAANSVVVGKIPANQVWGGAPAKFIKLI